MPFVVSIADAQARFPQYTFLAALTPSEQKAAFHVRDAAGRHLCLKVIAPGYDVRRVEREIQAMQALQHPNVVRLVEYTFSATGTGTTHYILEEFVDGDDLSVHLTGAPWARPRASRFFAAMADGLAAIAEKDLVHRDLKPSNVRVRANEVPVIIDFGLARHLQLTDLTTTAQGARIGTPAYFAPEQFTGTRHDVDHRTDLFAFGVLAYQALVGLHPFSRLGMDYAQLQTEVCASVAFKQDATFKALPPMWQLIVGKLLAKSRAERPTNAAQVASILRKLETV